ncbi:hypothetical protein EJ04DRAFT_574049 [Polyplosphaeria fusca]|uniref:F-box domain-containing protein n=1 Tax=Polyplosphaeria fusca TaxID=682080 RepID=A0A9P4R280_9PLEO|nr:hypothetical protein EJ04DRAFT_574049 [Polyplosphaeria fusca]
MAAVPSLPVELTSRILELVDSKSTLLNAALCSQQWYDIATPHLYNHVHLAGDDSEGAVTAAVKLFLRKPDLAAYVHHLAVRPAIDNGPIDQNENITLSEALAQAGDLDDMFKDAIAHDSRCDKDQIRLLNNARNADGLLALLIPRLSNLETLDLETPISPGCVQRMLQFAGANEERFAEEPALAHLHSLVWVYDDNKYGGNIIANPLLLPSMRSLFLHRIGSGDEEVDEELQNIGHGTSACTHIEMKDCRFNDTDIKNYIAAPKRLSTFIYELGWGHLSYCSPSFAAIRDALECQKDSLEDLWLDYGFDGIEWYAEDTNENDAMKSIRHFSQLKRLRIAGNFVFGASESAENEEEQTRCRRLQEFLPPSLEILHFTHGDDQGEMLYKALEHVLEECNIRTPKLREVVLDTSLPRIKDDGLRLASILRLAESANVNFKLVNNWGDQKYQMYDQRVEHKWGMDEDLEWAECTSGCNSIPIFETVDLQH